MTKNALLAELPKTENKSHATLERFALTLRRNPGMWKAWPFPTTGKNTCYNIGAMVRRGAYKQLPAGEFTASTRNRVTYVSYIGQADAA
ncbi:hypothetical protein [Nocardia thailandica]|uniref:hypothetical protein n=1 Tax=Nocardia thailandica TaxID=257275 RepID=UPI0002E1EFEF|nr:hypothetical protein [Nocardia thailandica]